MYQVDVASAYERARTELADTSRTLAAAEDAAAEGDASALALLRSAQERFAAAQRRLDVTLAARSAVLRERLHAA
jgi:hypothetical protein